MRFNLVRTVELSVLLVLLLTSVGGISSADRGEPEDDPFGVEAAREWQHRVLDYLKSPTIK